MKKYGKITPCSRAGAPSFNAYIANTAERKQCIKAVNKLDTPFIKMSW